MIGQLSAQDFQKQLQDTRAGIDKRKFDRFMARAFGVSKMEPGLVLDFEVNLGEGQKRGDVERMSEGVRRSVDWALENGYTPMLELVSNKRSLKYGTVKYEFRVLQQTETNAARRNFLGELAELIDPFVFYQSV